MKPVDNEVVLHQLQWRYATKSFDPAKKISDEDWQTLEKSLVLTPSSFGLQPWRFVVVKDQTIKNRLPEHSWGQRQVADASHVVVFAARTKLDESDIDRHVARTAEVRGGNIESLGGFRRMMVSGLLGSGMDLAQWASLQCYIALGQFMASAAMLGIDTCPMEGITRSKYDEVLGLNDIGYQTVVACPAGYRSEGDKYATLPKVRFHEDDVLIKF